MTMDAFPIWALLGATIVLVLVAVEAGCLLGRQAQRRAQKDKVPPVSSIVASTLGLLAFMLVYTFGIVASRYDARKALVRDEANVIRTTWLRADFLPEPDRTEAVTLIRKYLDHRLNIVGAANPEAALNEVLTEATRIQHRLWNIGIANQKNILPPAIGLYFGSVNQMMDLHALRVVIGLELRIPPGIWIALYALLVLGMMSVGYQSVVAESIGRSGALLMLALSFSVMMALIIALDRPQAGLMPVSMQPLQDARAWMEMELPANRLVTKP